METPADIRHTVSDGVPSWFIARLLEPGATIRLGCETFTMQSLVGSGGLGVIIKAQRRNGDTVAVKFLFDNGDTESRIMKERFFNEIRTTKMVGEISEWCVKVYECGSYDAGGGIRVPFYVMEHVPGLSLEDLILLRQRPFEVPEICALVWLIADAIKDIHCRNIVHRDIKPSNILFDENRAILKVTDFGISKDLKSAVNVTTHSCNEDMLVLGTVHYLSRYSFEKVIIREEEVTENRFGEYVHRGTGTPVYKNFDGSYDMPYKGNKLDLSVLSSTILFEIITRCNPFRNASLTGAINDIISGKKLNLKAFCKDNPGRIDRRILQSARLLNRFADIIQKGTIPDMHATYAGAVELQRDIAGIGKKVTKRAFDKTTIRDIMKNFFGVTLGEDFLLTLSGLQNGFRNGELYDDPDNIQRILLLYKLRRSDRFMELVRTLEQRSGHIAAARREGDDKEARFLCRLFGRLYHYSMDRRHLELSEALRQ